ncbi:hypothetical protein I4U23_022798 [Adineta vaga]|nr:hypothetical protein I4U23_022798 [Adineta vaga]
MYFDDFENNKIDGATLLSEDFTEIEQKELIPCIRDRVIFKTALRELRNSVTHNEPLIHEDFMLFEPCDSSEGKNNLFTELFNETLQMKIIDASSPFGGVVDHPEREIYRCYDGDKLDGFWNSMGKRLSLYD